MIRGTSEVYVTSKYVSCANSPDNSLLCRNCQSNTRVAALGRQFVQSARKGVPRQEHKREGELAATEQVQGMEMLHVRSDLQEGVSAQLARARPPDQRYQNGKSKGHVSAVWTRIPEAVRAGGSRVSARTVGATQGEEISSPKCVQVFNVLQAFCYEDTIAAALFGAWR